MSTKKHLFIGFGDIARRSAEKLVASDAFVVGIARSEKLMPNGVALWQGDITDEEILDRIAQHTFDSVVITLTPDARDPNAYQQTYLQPIQKLVKLWTNNAPKVKRIIFVSSTRVYGQSNDEWVDETSQTLPSDEQGEILLQAEQCLLQSNLPVCVLRFSGIYGPQRDFLIRQVQAGKAGDDHFTNRIHIEDCCGLILFLIETLPISELPKILLGSDNTPVKSSMIRAWLAQQLGVVNSANSANDATTTNNKTNTSQKSRTGSKRCNNTRLLQLGYQFKYPRYQDGYSEIIKAIKNL